MEFPAVETKIDNEQPTKRTLLEAVNAGAAAARFGALALSGSAGFVIVTMASLTHKDLLLNTPVVLPFMEVQIPLLRFFIFAPIFLLVIHALALLQHVMLRGTMKAFNDSLADSPQRSDPLRLELSSYFFTQVYCGPRRSPLITSFLYAANWLTLVLLPVLTLLYFQVSFLPRHNWAVTWAHRGYLTADLFLLFMMGTLILFPDKRLFSAPLHRLIYHPLLSFGVHGTIAASLLFSFLIATLPDSAMDHLARRILAPLHIKISKTVSAHSPLARRFTFASSQSSPVFWLTEKLFDGEPDMITGKTTSLFARNLIVMNTDLVPDDDSKEKSGEVSLNLRGRDFRYARLDGSDLHRADLTGADLSNARLVHANISRSHLRKAKMRNTNLNWADINGADLREANLYNATMREANLQDADLRNANLNMAMLSWANLKNANLSRADMSDATASWANLDGAKLVWTDLDDANLFSVSLRNANYSNWQLSRTVLNRADFGNVSVSPDFAGQPQPAEHDLTGRWSGEAVQPKFSGKSKSYPVRLTINAYGNGIVDYPSLSCSGLDSGTQYGKVYIFEEKIAEGRDHCRDGHVKLHLSGNTLHWQWFYDDGRFGASGELKREE